MSYSIKEIYFTIQGEGFQTGKEAIFCRFLAVIYGQVEKKIAVRQHVLFVIQTFLELTEKMEPNIHLTMI